MQSVKLNNGVEIPILGFGVFQTLIRPNVKDVWLTLFNRDIAILILPLLTRTKRQLAGESNNIWEMSRVGFELYRGNYSAYLLQRQERWERRQEVFESEKERLSKDVDYIKRNLAGQNVTQARGRLRRLTRYLQAVEQLGLEAVIGRQWGEVSEEATTTVSLMSVEEAERNVRSLKAPSNRPLKLLLRLKPELRSGEIILRAHDLQVGYPGNPLFRIDELELRRLECTTLIGPNGAGKTTFLKLLLGQVPPLAG